MGIQLAVLFQILITIIIITIAIKLVMVFFRIAKSLEGIDETLFQIHNKIEDKSHNNNNSDEN